MGLLPRWNDVKYAFAVVNLLAGDIPKVTPSSKMVGDFAIFLLKNDLMVRKDDPRGVGGRHAGAASLARRPGSTSR